MNQAVVYMKYWFVYLASVSCIYARLGDDRDALVSRLGPVRLESKHSLIAQGQISELGPALFFEKDLWQIQCDMVDGHCVHVTYSKKGDWTAEQIKTLLQNNAQSSMWSEARDSTKMVRKWQRKDGGTAKWQFTGSMEFISPAYLQAKVRREAELKSKAEKKPDL